MNKKDIRRDILGKRNDISQIYRKEWDDSIFSKLINSDLYKEANRLFIYVNYSSEVNTIEIIKRALRDKKDIYVPKTCKESKSMVAVKINSLNGLIVDKYGISEPPVVDKSEIASDFDLIIMPGVAFDIHGNRIGYGGGYYDKYIFSLEKNIKKVALAYEIQIVEEIESEIHDIKVDYIITNEKIMKV